MEAPSPLAQPPRSSLFFAKDGGPPPSPHFRPRTEPSHLRYNSQSHARPASSYAGSLHSRDRYPPSMVSGTTPSARPWSFAESMETPANHLEQVDEADVCSIYAYDSTASLTQQRAAASYFPGAPPLKEDVDDTANPRVVSWDGM
ncbi:hypothetical protein HWV62_34519 [Athelia sp. TMB]|nr:hypothetical protein HWV62_34519 [Athelia sp. TMB]